MTLDATDIRRAIENATPYERENLRRALVELFQADMDEIERMGAYLRRYAVKKDETSGT